MIKIALKHFVIESCINMLFDRIDCNLKDLSFKVGDRIPILHVVSHDHTLYAQYHDVIIKSMNDPTWKCQSIYIDYKSRYVGCDYEHALGDYSIEIPYRGIRYFCTFSEYSSNIVIWVGGSSTISTT
jgi:hypothetical protein